jgi:hypothetical protein
VGQLCSEASTASLVEGMAALVGHIEGALGGLQGRQQERYAALLQQEQGLTGELEAFLAGLEGGGPQPAAAAARAPAAPHRPGAKHRDDVSSRCGAFQVLLLTASRQCSGGLAGLAGKYCPALHCTSGCTAPQQQRVQP